MESVNAFFFLLDFHWSLVFSAVSSIVLVPFDPTVDSRQTIRRRQHQQQNHPKIENMIFGFSFNWLRPAMNETVAHASHRKIEISRKEKYENFGNNFVRTAQRTHRRVTEYVLNTPTHWSAFQSVNTLQLRSLYRSCWCESSFVFFSAFFFFFFASKCSTKHELRRKKENCQVPIASCSAHHRMPIVESKKEIISSGNCRNHFSTCLSLSRSCRSNMFTHFEQEKVEERFCLCRPCASTKSNCEQHTFLSTPFT